VDDLARELEEYLHQRIPISRQMGVRVLSLGEDGIRLSAPLAPNVNHRGTVFGGSAGTLAILSAWTLLHARLRQAAIPGRVVIQRSAMEYLHPIHGDFEARCPHPSAEEWERFLDALQRRRRGRLILHAEVIGDGRVACTFQAAFVAFLPKQEG